MGMGELYSRALSPSSPRCAEVIVYVKSSLLPLFPTLGTHMKCQDEILFKGGRVVTPLVGVTGCVPRPTGLSLVTLFFLFVSIKDRPLLWMVVRS